ncbi:hypothetical protein D3C80_1996190 [compost metagenome]
MFGIAVGHVDADKLQRWGKCQDLLHLDEVGFRSPGRHHHMTQHGVGRALNKLGPLLNGVVFMNGGENVEGCQGLGHAEGANRIHIGGNNRHTGPVVT